MKKDVFMFQVRKRVFDLSTCYADHASSWVSLGGYHEGPSLSYYVHHLVQFACLSSWCTRTTRELHLCVNYRNDSSHLVQFRSTYNIGAKRRIWWQHLLFCDLFSPIVRVFSGMAAAAAKLKDPSTGTQPTAQLDAELACANESEQTRAAFEGSNFEVSVIGCINRWIILNSNIVYRYQLYEICLFVHSKFWIHIVLWWNNQWRTTETRR